MSDIMAIGGSAFGAVYGVLCVWSALLYVLSSLGKYTIARRRKIPCSWLAWLPLGNIWVLGKIADHYQLVAAGRRTRRAVTLLILTILIVILAFLAGICLGVSGSYLSAHQLEPGSLLVLICGIFLFAGSLALCVAQKIVGHVSYHSLYRSCKPSAATGFVVLGIFFPFLIPFFLMACRKHDEGLISAVG